MKATKPAYSFSLATNLSPTRARSYSLNINPNPTRNPKVFRDPSGSGRVADLYLRLRKVNTESEDQHATKTDVENDTDIEQGQEFAESNRQLTEETENEVQQEVRQMEDTRGRMKQNSTQVTIQRHLVVLNWKLLSAYKKDKL